MEKKAQKGDKITMGERSGTEVEMTGDIPGNKINVNGEDEGPVTIKDVSYVPSANFNLFPSDFYHRIPISWSIFVHQ